MADDTIFALATVRGRSGIAVVRLSGPGAHAAVAALSRPPEAPRRAALRKLRKNGQLLDQALVLTFAAPASFTGEDMAELHLHGSIATVDAVLSALADMPGLRAAEPGEFTRRALENEKLDLTQVEGLADLIEAETEAQRRQALRVLSGALGDRAESWRARLIRAAALLEATIDFADEEVPVDVTPEVAPLLSGVTDELSREIGGARVAERIREGFEVAIVGPPNAGKSTLLNTLAGREAAITSEIAGTTRDVIEVRMDLAGLPVTFLDTAGLREAQDDIENIGIERARARAGDADLRIILREAPDAAPAMAPQPGDVVVVPKADIIPGGDISAVTGQGIDALMERVTEELQGRAAGVGAAIRARHAAAMRRAAEALEIAQDRLKTSPDMTELVAEDLRSAVRALDSLVGRVDVEHILDEIFASFCIGK